MILAVDDEPLNLLIIKELFEDTHEIVTVESGEEALLELEKNVPDIILLDVMMPGINGIKVCEKVRSMPEMKNVKVIMISGSVMESEVSAGLAAGADDYICKPFDMNELVNLVDSYS